MADMVSKGRQAAGDRHGLRLHPESVSWGDRNGMRLHPESVTRGIKHPAAKLDDEKVRSIRTAYANGGISHRRLAKLFGVSEGVIRRIILRKKWKHVL